ncbi:MAG: Ig-like domain-containing protein, partial [Pseudomonadota bacterium]
MAIVSTSGSWDVNVRDAEGVASLDDFDFSEPTIYSDTIAGSIDQALAEFDGPSNGDPYVATLTAEITLDSPEDISFYLFAAGHAKIYIDDVLLGDVTVADQPGAGPGPCPANGGAVCLCQADNSYAQEKVTASVGEGTHTIRVEYLNLDPSEAMEVNWEVGKAGIQAFDLTIPVNAAIEDLDGGGEWGAVFDTEIMGIHQVMLGDGRVLYWGDGGEGNAFSNTLKYGIYDPSTGEFEILDAAQSVFMFCGAGVLIPGTDQVLVAAGNNNGNDDGRIFDTSDNDLEFVPEYMMADGRFYPTMVSLSTGQLVILGGDSGGGVATPEIFTNGEGWTKLNGATDPDVGANWWYPKAWVNKEGKILYIAVDGGGGLQNGGVNAAGTFEVMELDPSGDGSIRQVAEVPFQMDVRSTAVMYDIGKVVIMDHNGDLWKMDFNGAAPTFEFVADLPTDRENGDMTVMADGRILLNGGTTNGNSQADADAVFESIIFDPSDNSWTVVDEESVLRVYHSSSILLTDGTIMSSGGGGLGGTRNFQSAQIYSPDYLFNDDGTLADRPVISLAPDSLVPGESFVLSVDDAATIARLSFVKTGAITHSTNMESGRMDLEFTVLSDTEIEVSLPENPHVVGAGNWMLFAIDDNGVPSHAPIISVLPTVPIYEASAGTLTAEYFVLDTQVSSLDQIDFTQPADVVEQEVSTIEKSVGSGSFWTGGPTEDFAARYTGEFTVETGGVHTFYLSSDDGSRLLIDGNVIVNHDGLHGTSTLSNTVNLSAGAHTIEVIYFERGGSATLDLDWAGPGFAREQMVFQSPDGGTLPDAIVNGDFEDVSAGTGSGSTPLGWITSGDGSGVFSASPDRGDGFAYALGGFSSEGGQTLEQKLGLTEGQAYRLSFDAGDALGSFTGRLLVVAGNADGTQILASLTPDQLGDSATYTADFVASGGVTTIKFIFDGDGSGDIDIDNVSLVEVINQDPVAVDDTEGAILASALVDGVRIDGTNVLQNDSDPDADPLSIAAVNGAPVVSPGWQGWRDADNGGQIVLNTDGRVQFRDIDGDFAQLQVGQQVATSITYEVSDGNGGTDTATITFLVEGTAPVGNVAPVAADDQNDPVLASDLPGARIDGNNLLANDTDANGDALSITAIGGEAVTSPGWQGWRDAVGGGQISINTDGRVQFRDIDGDFDQLQVGQQAEASTTYEISDGNGGTDTATVTFLVDGTAPAGNAAPVAADDQNGPVLASDLPGARINGENLLANDTDANGDALSITAVSGEAVTSPGWQGWRDAVGGGQISINTDGRVQFRDVDGDFAQLQIGQQAEASTTYEISDGNGGTDTATVTFLVDGTAPTSNVAPIAVDDQNGPVLTSALAPDVRIDGTNVLDNDTDANGDTLTVSAIGGQA